MNTMMKKSFLLIALFVQMWVSPAIYGQSSTTGAVVIKNETGEEITIHDLKYVDANGSIHVINATWTLKPGFNGYLKFKDKKIYANKITYDLESRQGKSKGWTCRSTGLDKDGDFTSRFSAENFQEHLKLIGVVRVVARKPALAGPTDEQIAKGVMKAIGALVLHEAAQKEPEDFADRLAIGIALKGRDELIKSAVNDVFTMLPQSDRNTISSLVPLALDGRLTSRNLGHAEAKLALQNHLRSQNPDFALAAEAADFLLSLQSRSR